MEDQNKISSGEAGPKTGPLPSLHPLPGSAGDAAHPRCQLKYARDEMRNAIACLARCAMHLQKAETFEATIKEVKETIGDLAVSEKMIEEFFSQNTTI